MSARFLAAAAVLWMAALLSAPVALASPRPAFSIGAAALYGAGGHICHQRPERCFWIRGRPMPVCARCTGLYAGAAAAGPLALLVAAGLSAQRARRLAAIAALPTFFSWGIEMAGLAHPPNAVRFGAAVPLGFVAAWLLITALSHARPSPARQAGSTG